MTVELDILCTWYSTNLLLRRRIKTLSKNAKWHNKILSVVGFVLIGTYSKLTRDQLYIWRSSVSLWKHASSIEAKSPELLSNLAEAYTNANRPKQSLGIFEKVLKMDGGKSAHFHHMYAETLSKIPKMQEKARTEYEMAIALDPLLSESMASLAWWHEEHNELDGGRTVYDYYRQAEETARMSTTVEGKEKRQQTRSKTNPNRVLKSTKFFLGYGLAIDRLVKNQMKGIINVILDGITLEESKDKYLKAIETDSSAREAYYRLGKLETSTEKKHDLYDLAISHAPNENFVDALFAKANLLHRNGHDLKAIPLYVKAMQFEPQATDLRINCAIAYRNVGDNEKAAEIARSILKIDSFHQKASALLDELFN